MSYDTEMVNQLQSLIHAIEASWGIDIEIMKSKQLIKRYVLMNQVKNTYIIMKTEIPIILYSTYDGKWYWVVGSRVEQKTDEEAQELLNP